MGSKKVVFCANEPRARVGGPMAWVARLLPALAERGWRVELLLFSDFPIEKSPLATELQKHAVTVKVAPLEHFTKQKVLWIFEQIAHDPPHVFVPNLVIPAYMGAAWLRKAGIPTIAVVHSDDDFYRSIQRRYIFGQKFFRVSGVVCVSDYLEQSVRSRNPAAAVCRIPCGAHIPESRSSRWSSSGVFRIIYVGRLVEKQKRIRELTQAFCETCGHDERFEATIIGDGQDKAEVQKVLEKYGSPVNVTLKPAIPNSEIQDELLKHHAFALLSDYEGLPIALMEAMACGLVPICTDMRSGIGELIEHGVNGLIVRDRGKDFAAAVWQLRDDHDLWARLSEAARLTICRRFDERLGFEQWHEFLLEQAQASNCRAPVTFPSKLVLPPIDPATGREDLRGDSFSRFPARLKPALQFAKNIARALLVRTYRA